MKNGWSNDALKDLDRIKGLVKTFGHKRGGTLRREFLAVFFSKQVKGDHKRKSIEESVNPNLERVIEDNSEDPEINMCCQYSDIYLEGKKGWVCICIEVALKMKK